jgi:hypothetical protein
MTQDTTSQDFSAHIAAIEAELAKILSMLSTAQRLMDEERVVDLAVLEARTRTLCAAVLDLPKLEARDIAPKLEDLLNQLDKLAGAMYDKFGELPVLPAHNAGTAAGAYANTLKHFP